ncbi:MAG: precorrin-4 C(11)-methyltransferase [Firmicutes bacterium]|nr:precorrin-4 C(11)-methyltransferase [Bacillota bacterium]
MERAKVWFVGAGCGAPDLITVRGMNLLKAADMVIYAGSLVNPELLRYTREGCEIFDSAYMDLEEVLDKFREGAEKGLTMVRLHTGDPSVYGAIKEQMDALDDMGIPYESCPGVSACFGAAASLDLEYTLPGISQSLIITRMAGRTGVPEKESIESFASHDSTMAIYLSAGSLGELSGRLVAGGYSPDTPAALVYKATWPDEKKFICTVSDLERVASENGIRKTAIVLVGRAIASNNYEKSKLYDRTFTTEFREGKE